MNKAFNPRIYVPLTLRDHKIIGDASALQDLGQIITTSDDGTNVTAQNSDAVSILGDVNLTSLMFENDKRLCLRDWIPFSQYISKSKLQHQSNILHNTIEQNENGQNVISFDDIYVKVFPYLDEKDSSSSSSMSALNPNRFLWVINRCRHVKDDTFPLYLVYDFLERIVDVLEREDNSELKNILIQSSPGNNCENLFDGKILTFRFDLYGICF